MTGKEILEHADASFSDTVRTIAAWNPERAEPIARAIRRQIEELFVGAGVQNREQQIAPATLENLAGGLRDRAEIFRQLSRDDARFHLVDGLNALAERLAPTGKLAARLSLAQS